MKKAIVGLSGGIDSCWALHKAVNSGFNIIALVTFDNGWDTEIAKENVLRASQYYGLPREIYKVDKKEFRKIQRAFLYASTPDAECPTDLAIKAFLLQAAKRHDAIIITGINTRTEGKMPESWSMIDYRYLKDVCKKFNVKLETFPRFNIRDTLQYKKKCYNILEESDDKYYPEYAKKTLSELYGWQDYGAKHHESIYTRFVRGLRYYKFGIDVRVIEYRAKLINGLIDEPTYYFDMSEVIVPRDRFLVDCMIVEAELDVDMTGVLKMPIRSFKNYKTYRYNPFVRVGRWLLSKM